MLPVCSPVSQLPPPHTQKQVVDTTRGHGKVIPTLLQPHILSLPKQSRNQTLFFFWLTEHRHLQSPTETTKLIFFSFQMKKKKSPRSNFFSLDGG